MGATGVYKDEELPPEERCLYNKCEAEWVAEIVVYSHLGRSRPTSYFFCSDHFLTAEQLLDGVVDEERLYDRQRLMSDRQISAPWPTPRPRKPPATPVKTKAEKDAEARNRLGPLADWQIVLGAAAYDGYRDFLTDVEPIFRRRRDSWPFDRLPHDEQFTYCEHAVRVARYVLRDPDEWLSEFEQCAGEPQARVRENYNGQKIVELPPWRMELGRRYWGAKPRHRVGRFEDLEYIWQVRACFEAERVARLVVTIPQWWRERIEELDEQLAHGITAPAG